MNKKLFYISSGTFLVLCALVVFVFVNPSFSRADIASNIQGYWTFDSAEMLNGVAQDLSGNGNNGRLRNIATSTFYTSGKVDEAFNFDGVNDYVLVDDSASLNILGPMTISMWIKVPDRAGYYGLVTKDVSNGGNIEYEWRIDQTTGLPVFIQNPSPDGTLTANTAPTVGVWQHVAVTRTGSMLNWTVTHYLNGVSNGSGLVPAGPTANTRPIYIGARDDNNLYFKGQMDDVRIYTRALTSNEIAEVFNESYKPAVTTNSASGISITGATLNGAIIVDLASSTSRGFAYATSSNLSAYVSTTTESGTFGIGSFSSGISSLTGGTTYYFRAYALNATSTGYGNIQSFTTDPYPLAVTTDLASGATAETITLNATITSIGNSNPTQKGFAYGTSSLLTTVIATSSLGSQVGTGSFTEGLSSLFCVTTYYARAYVVNISDTAYGSIVPFTTGACAIPTAVTSPANFISTSSATLNASTTSIGGDPIIENGFAYGTDSSLVDVIATTTGATLIGDSLSESVSDLTCGETYYFRGYFTNSTGTGYGSIETFTTDNCSPTVTTASASSVSITTSTLNGNITLTGGADAIEKGFAYGTDSTLATVIATSTLGSHTGTGTFTESLSGLTCATVYYVRSYAINTSGSGYGSIETFTTSACPVANTSSRSGSRGSSVVVGLVSTVPTPSIVPIIPVDEIPYTDPVIRTTLSEDNGTDIVENIEDYLPTEIISLANKLPTFRDILEKLGIRKASDINALKYLPSPLSSIKNKAEIPTEFMFAQVGSNGEGKAKIDLPVTIQVTEKGNVEQKVRTISGTILTLSVKPDGPAEKITGYLSFRKVPEKIVVETGANTNIAGILVSYLALTDSSQNTKEITDKDLVVDTFEYTDEDGDGVYTVEIQAPRPLGEYDVVANIKYVDKNKNNKEIHLVTLIDPEGYVFEKTGNFETRIPDVKIILWKGSPGQSEIWSAEDYKQTNPQITDKTGQYSFLVPPGSYYITAEAKDYDPYQSEVFNVSDGGEVHFNIELHSSNSLIGFLTDWRYIVLISIAVIILLMFALKIIKKLWPN